MTQCTQNAGSFLPDELVPATGHARPRDDEAADDRLAAALAAYSRIRIPNRRHDGMIAYLGRVTSVGLASGEGRKLGGRALAPTASGKTTCAETFREAYEAKGRHRAGEKPVVIVPLDAACTARRLFSAILRALGDPECENGSEDVLRSRSYMALRRLGVRLLVIDEVQHLRSRSKERNDISDVLKRFLDDGVVPLVLLGTDEATAIVNANKQLSMRLHAPCDLSPLDRARFEDRRVFKSYVADLDGALVSTGVMRRPSNLSDKRTLSCLFAISDGVLGRVSNLVREAVAHAALRDADLVEPFDLSRATSTWAIAQEIIDHDPFVAGVRPRAVKDAGRGHR